MRHDDVPNADERLRQIARILATGILRLKQRGALSVESSPPALAHCSETRLSVHTG